MNQANAFVADRQLMQVTRRSKTDFDLACPMLRRICHKLVSDQPNRLDGRGRDHVSIARDDNLPIQDSREISAEPLKEGNARYIVGHVDVKVAVNLSDSRHTIGGQLKVGRGLFSARRSALHRQQAGYELQAVHHSVVNFLGHQVGLAHCVP